MLAIVKKRNTFTVVSLLLFCWSSPALSAAEFQFRHHFIDRDLPVRDKTTGNYGLTALADLDRDGDLDFVLGGRPFKPLATFIGTFNFSRRATGCAIWWAQIIFPMLDLPRLIWIATDGPIWFAAASGIAIQAGRASRLSSASCLIRAPLARMTSLPPT